MPKIQLNLALDLDEHEIKQQVEKRAREALSGLLTDYFKGPVVTGNPAWNRNAGPGHQLIKEAVDTCLLSETMTAKIAAMVHDEVERRVSAIVADRVERQVRKQVQQEIANTQEGTPK